MKEQEKVRKVRVLWFVLSYEKDAVISGALLWNDRQQEF